MTRQRACAAAAVFLLCSAGCSQSPGPTTLSGVPLVGPLVPSSTTMVTAWDVPQNPLSDALDDSPLFRQVQWGFRIFMNTPGEAARFTPGKMSCANCHLNAGQRELSLPLVNVAGMFPEYNRRAGRIFSLNDRIVGCFYRSQNATGRSTSSEGLPSPTSPEVEALAAYLVWLSQGAEMGKAPEWRGQNKIPVASRVPIDELDPQRGEELFLERCTNCHGTDGQGVEVGDKKPGPLWGPDSWNDGAGAARVYTLAGIIRFAMPYLDPGSLSDTEAQELAAFITSKPRPSYPFKDQDYLIEALPADSVYYARR
jgi:thiosulfate dehydrogenase